MGSGGKRTRFVADSMFGSLARKLRLLGIDTAYFRAGGDKELLELAIAEDRVILTADRQLAFQAAKSKTRAVYLDGRTDAIRIAMLSEVARTEGIKLTRGESLCSVCGSGLQRVSKGEIRGLVPDGVLRRHRVFFRCTSCGRTYWKGRHWKKLRWIERQLASDVTKRR